MAYPARLLAPVRLECRSRGATSFMAFDRLPARWPCPAGDRL